MEFRLVEPNSIYKDSFQANVLSYKNDGEEFYYNLYKEALDDFDLYVDKLIGFSKGEGLKENWVSFSTFWLANSEDEILGVIRVRHKEIPLNGHIGYDVPPRHRKNGYGKMMLKLSLKNSKELGLDEVIVTCEENNISSEKIIKSANGEFLGLEKNDHDNKMYKKFRIKI